MTRCAVFLALAIAAAFPAAAAPFADAVHVAPDSTKSLDAQMNPIPQSELTIMLSEPTPHHVFDVYAGENDALAAQAENSQPLQVGVGFSTDLGSQAMFDDPGITPDGTALEYRAAISSVDAVMLRLQIDLRALAPDQQVFVVDPLGPRALGPFTADDSIDGGRWLPTIEGDTAVLIVRTPGGELPIIRLLGVCHFFRRIELLKELSCNFNVACLTDTTLLEASSGVGMMVRTTFNGDSAICSGTLINNPDTAINEPYYITANHCIPGAISAQQADIIWDFRTDGCQDTTPPLLSTLPRSNVTQMLETDELLDITLVQLDNVPSGDFGRTYVGWDTREPLIGEDVVGIHHPDGSYMRVSFGDVAAIDQPGFGSLPYFNQTEVKWSKGVTEGGSSGSCLLFERDARLLGTLSNGPAHSCTNTTNNKDRYASFRDFFPQIEQYLTGDGGAGPSIELSEASHAFGSELQPWTFQVWNGDVQSTLTFTISNVPDWLNVTPVTGQSTGPTDARNIVVTPIPDYLAPGLNTASLQISAPGAASRTVIVTAMGEKGIGCSGVAGRGIDAGDIVALTVMVLALATACRQARVSVE